MKNKALQNQNFSKFKIDWTLHDKDYISVFAIPKNREADFVHDPRLAYQSLDAKELYRIGVAEYAMNPQLHDTKIEINFENHASYMLHLMGVDNGQ